MIVFGPVPSRRLGQSLGINNIPPKTCSYSCVYCQIGRTNRMRAERCEFYKPEAVFAQTEKKLTDLGDERVDYLTFVPDGEPTLDINLGRHIDSMKPYGIRIAVITNASLLWMDDVKEDLQKADYVSVKIDAVDRRAWEKTDRPHGSLTLEKVLRGVTEFAKRFEGTLVTETMLVKGYNDDSGQIKETAAFIKSIGPEKAYLLVPTRPPAETGVLRPTAESLRNAYDVFRQNGLQAECVTGKEDDGFYFSDDVVSDLLSITSVHPIREDVVVALLEKRNLNKSVIDRLVEKKLIGKYVFEGETFYKRNI